MEIEIITKLGEARDIIEGVEISEAGMEAVTEKIGHMVGIWEELNVDTDMEKLARLCVKARTDLRNVLDPVAD